MGTLPIWMIAFPKLFKDFSATVKNKIADQVSTK